MDRAYGDERNPIVSKSEFVLSLFEQLIGDGMVTERKVHPWSLHRAGVPAYIRNGYKGTPPTLQDFYRLLKMQPETEAQGLALSSEAVHYRHAEHICPAYQCGHAGADHCL